MIATYRYFSMSERGKPEGWFQIQPPKYSSEQALFDDVAGFLTSLGPDRIIAVNLARAPDMHTHFVVWYWEQQAER